MDEREQTRQCHRVALLIRQHVVHRSKADSQLILGRILNRIEQIVQNPLNRFFAVPAGIEPRDVFDIDRESETLLRPERVSNGSVTENHGGERTGEAFAEGDAHIEPVAERMRPTNRIRAEERIFNIVPPFVQDDSPIIFLGIIIFPAEEKNSAELRRVDADADRTAAGIGKAARPQNRTIIGTPMQRQRRKVERRIHRQ